MIAAIKRLPTKPETVPEWIQRGPNDYPDEVLTQENGCYRNSCCCCNSEFLGPKRAVSCSPCWNKHREEWESMTQEERDDILSKAAIAANLL